MIFDQYQRYKTMQILVNSVKEYYNIDKLNILEVGSNEHLNLKKFLPNENITYSDLSIPKNIPVNVQFIAADATNLKDIRDNEFDVVLSSDVFEHIPEEKREDFLKETNRVAKLSSIHCFPFESEAVISAELSANEYYKSMFGRNHIWLQEHIDNGLPDVNKLNEVISNFSNDYFMFEHGDILLWEDMTKLASYTEYVPEVLPLRKRIEDFYQQSIFTHDIGESNYRKFIVVTNDKNLKDKVESNINNIFDNKLPERYLNFLYKNIEDIRSIVQLPINRENLEKNEQLTLYLDKGNGFNEDLKITKWYKINNSKGNLDVFADIPQNIKKIRIDPIEGKVSVIDGLTITSNNGPVDYKLLNGFSIDACTIFDNNDPKIEIDCSLEQIEWIKIQGNICAFNDVAAIGILNKMRLILKKENQNILLNNKIEEQGQDIQKLNDSLVKNESIIQDKESIIQDKESIIQDKESIIQDKENHIQNLNNMLENYVLHYNAAIAQRDDFTSRLAQVELERNSIINSASWKITKPIRIVLDFIKNMLKSNRYTHLCCKILKDSKQNGVKYTVNRVKYEHRINNGYIDYKLPSLLTKEERQLQVNTKFSKNVKFSIVVPLYNTPKNFLCEMINSCIDQTYDNWELCLADGSDKKHKYVKKIVKKYMKKDSRIKYKLLHKNDGISENTNECIKMATGEYIALFDHDDILDPSVLFEYMKVICEQEADFIYCDEDKFDTSIINCYDPHFKPDFAIDNLRANNYICHFTVFKRDLLDEVGLFKKEFDGSQDHDMVLRLTEKANHIIHVPKILYHWRVSSNSVASDPYAKPYTIKAGIDAVTEHLNRCDLNVKVESSIVHPNIYRIKYNIIGKPLVSILIPNKDHIVDLSRCINSILKKSTYKNIEIIIIENNSTEHETFDYYKALEKYDNIKVVTYESDGKFNYSAINNFGVTFANGEHLLFLNNDIEIISENWLEEMLMYSQREDVGAVGAKLYYPNDTIQHAGLGLGILALAGHYFRNFDKNCVGYMGNLFFARNVTAVTAACLMMKKRIFNEIDGFDEEGFAVAFNDVDLCMKIRKAGYLIVWTPYAEAYHYESISRGSEDTPEKQARFKGEVERFQEKWKKELEQGDPYYNTNLTLEREDFSFR